MTDLFFSEEIPEIAQAKRICAQCPVLTPCLEEAIDRREQWGVWGGQLFIDGRAVSQKRSRGRPKANPDPATVLPTVPVPTHLVERLAMT